MDDEQFARKPIKRNPIIGPDASQKLHQPRARKFQVFEFGIQAVKQNDCYTRRLRFRRAIRKETPAALRSPRRRARFEMLFR